MNDRVISNTWPPSGSLAPPKLLCKCMNLECPNDHYDQSPPALPAVPRTFDLVRYHDVSGVSGEGVVAQGVQFNDGQVALQWPEPGRSVAVWDSVDAMLGVHGHNGLTVVRFHDGDD